MGRSTLFPRLLAQLQETEAAFDEFWAKHQQRLEQCLRLRHFEQDFREVSVPGHGEHGGWVVPGVLGWPGQPRAGIQGTMAQAVRCV